MPLDQSAKIPHAVARIEIVAVVATALLHLLLSNMLRLQGVFIVVALLGWIGYAVVRARRDPRLLGVWGFSRRGLRSTFLAASAAAIVALAAMALFAHHRGALHLHPHLIPLLLLYPLWGLVQQFLVLALFAGNLTQAKGWIGTHWFIVPASAVLFGLVHLPDWRLVGATFPMGLVFTPIYLRWRNLWPLGLLHGWLGALCYFWVLGRNPWQEIMG